jgi:hypothetical protein
MDTNYILSIEVLFFSKYKFYPVNNGIKPIATVTASAQGSSLFCVGNSITGVQTIEEVIFS